MIENSKPIYNSLFFEGIFKLALWDFINELKFAVALIDDFFSFRCIDKWFLKSQTCPEHPPD